MGHITYLKNSSNQWTHLHKADLYHMIDEERKKPWSPSWELNDPLFLARGSWAVATTIEITTTIEIIISIVVENEFQTLLHIATTIEITTTIEIIISKVVENEFQT